MTHSSTPSILWSHNWPSDLSLLSYSEFETLAQEIRAELVSICDETGGHLASNLGVVELTIALHTVLNSPTDKILWDTSHQCYVHKMLTGRLDQMRTIRQDGGLSGFAKISESPHDIFGAGHASTSLSAALGVAHARDHLKQDYAVAAVFGDAALSGGMAFEALNNIKNLKGNFIGILNDNNMAISRPVGKMADIITQVRTSVPYGKLRDTYANVMKRVPKIGEPLLKKVDKAVERFRSLVIETPSGVIFEEFGLKYFGPIDGHNISQLIAAINFAKSCQFPVMLHVITVKGKGLEKAELDPIKYHGVKPVKPKHAAVSCESSAGDTVCAPTPESTSESNTESSTKSNTKSNATHPAPKPLTFSEVFGDECIAIAQKHPDVVVITPAMCEGSGLKLFSEKCPDQFYDVGIAEEHAVTFAAGLARAGARPIVSVYSTFLQRGFDQLVHDVCLQALPVLFCLDRAGLAGEDGPTHHGVLDINFMLSVPNLVVMAPRDGDECRAMMRWALNHPIATSIRYPKGSAASHPQAPFSQSIELGKSEILRTFSSSPISDTPRPNVLLLAVGPYSHDALDAATELDKQGINCGVVNLRFLKPLDIALLSDLVPKADIIVVIEDTQIIGGVGSFIRQSLPVTTSSSQWRHIGIPDRFIDHGQMTTLRHSVQLDREGIVATVRAAVESLNSSALHS